MRRWEDLQVKMTSEQSEIWESTLSKGQDASCKSVSHQPCVLAAVRMEPISTYYDASKKSRTGGMVRTETCISAFSMDLSLR